MEHRIWRGAGIIGILLLLGVWGYAGNKGSQAMSGNSDLKRLLQLQQQKAAAREVEPPLPEGMKATAETHEQAGDSYLRQGNFVSAFTEYQKAIEMEPARVMTHYKMGMPFLSRNLPDEALKEFEQVLAKEPNNAYDYHGRARVSFSRNRLDQAKEDLLKALALKNDMWQAHTLLGVICDRQRQYGQAEEAYEKAAAIQPTSAAIYNNLGVSRYLMSRYDDAADALLKAFTLEPENPRICNNLGLALYRLGRTDDAIEAFRRGGDQAAAFNNVGYLEMKEGQYRNAVAALERAIDAKPSYYEKAQKNLEKARAIIGNGEDRVEPAAISK